MMRTTRNNVLSVATGVGATAALAAGILWSGSAPSAATMPAQGQAGLTPTPGAMTPTPIFAELVDQAPPGWPGAPVVERLDLPLSKEDVMAAMLGGPGPTGPVWVLIEDEHLGFVEVEEAAHLGHHTDEDLAEMDNREHGWTQLTEANPELKALHRLLLETSRQAEGMSRLLGVAMGGDLAGVAVTPPARAQLRLSLGDMNGDGDLNTQDLELLMGMVGPTTPCGADFDLNGVIDAADVETLLRLIGAHQQG